jgi:hypothetical protein
MENGIIPAKTMLMLRKSIVSYDIFNSFFRSK